MQHAVCFDIKLSIVLIKSHEILRFFPLNISGRYHFDVTSLPKWLCLCLYLIGSNVDIQHALCFYLEHSMTSIQDCKIYLYFSFNISDGCHFILASPKCLSQCLLTWYQSSWGKFICGTYTSIIFTAGISCK